jgi:uncharacterized protein (TIGR02285 family)
MESRHVIVRLLVLLLLSSPCLADDLTSPENRITWYHANFPPVTIPYGPDAGTGFYDRITQFIIQRLDGYEHDFQVANFKRIISEIRSQAPVCCATLYKTPEREKYVAFSMPVVVVLPSGIIARKTDAGKLSAYVAEDNRISFERVMQDGQFSVGVAKGRAYTGAIDTILDRYRSSPLVIERAGKDVFKGLFEMLLAGRVDLIIGYPTEAQYVGRTMGQDDRVVFHPVAEMSQNYTLGHVGCPKNEWGRTIIRQVDAILETYRSTPEFTGFYEHWIDAQTIPAYRQITRDVFAADNAP